MSESWAVGAVVDELRLGFRGDERNESIGWRRSGQWEGVTGEMGGTGRWWKRERRVWLYLPKAIKSWDGHHFLGKNIATSNLPIWKWFCGGSATVLVDFYSSMALFGDVDRPRRSADGSDRPPPPWILRWGPGMADSVHGNQKAYRADERRAGEAVVLCRVLGAAILRWQVMGEGKEGEMSLTHVPHATTGWRTGGGHVSLLGDAMTEGEWERVRRGRGEDLAAGSRRTRGGGVAGDVWLRHDVDVAIDELPDNASFSVAGAGFPCAMRGEDSGLRCREIERPRQKHGNLVDGQEQRCALLDDGVRTPGEAGARGGRRKPAERREGAPMAAISSCKIFMA
ncbi:hypothetical protein B0H14DRAFT_3157734 [Mycena olivaceomarginata]|nr:hypothetical protein B0H14DRAFT_3157734 [Mycena olivaceomarginata]